MEVVRTVLDNPKRFDEVVHSSLPEGMDLELISKFGAMSSGRSAVAITFTVQLSDGSMARAQAVTSLRALKAAVDMLVVYHEREDPHRN